MAGETAADYVADALRHLVRGVKDRKSAFHIIGLATTGADGAPCVRSVVLRAWTPATGELVFHTDRRASKVAELAADPRACLLAYDEAARLQIRLRGRVAMQPALRAVWDALPAMSRLIYRVGTTPGAPVSDAPDLDDAAGLANFVVCTVQVTAVDVLHLAAGGHRRAVASLGPQGLGAATWVGP